MEENLKQFTARNIFSNIGFLSLSILGGMLTGAIFGIIGSFIYLIIVFPALMGAIGGIIISKNARYTKTMNAVSITTVSVLTVIALYFAFHYMRYTIFLATAGLQTFGVFSGESFEAGKVVVKYILEEETGRSGFIGYMLYKAQQGISIGRRFSSDRLNLGPVLTWVYWLLESGLISFMAISGSKNIKQMRLCEHCNSWYTEKEHVGGTPINKQMEILNSVKQKDFASVGAALEENSETPSLEFYLQSCTSCDKGNSFLSITSAQFLNGRLVSKDISEVSMRPIEKKSFMEGIKFVKV